MPDFWHQLGAAGEFGPADLEPMAAVVFSVKSD
jgi:hypothetical protein